MYSPRVHPSARLLVALAVLFLCTVPAVARDVVPAPPGGGPGVSLFPQDQQGARDRPAPSARDMMLERIGQDDVVPAAGRDPDLGGDDMTVMTCTAAYRDDLAVASNGTLFSIIMWDNDNNHYRLTIRRSIDGGTTWSTWATFYNPDPGYRYWEPEILVAEGAEDRVIVGYWLDPDDGSPTELHLAWSPLDLASGDFSHDITLATCDEGIFGVSLATDAASFSEYYVYATWAAKQDATGDDIYFARSVNQGDSWEAPYVIASIGVTDRGYYSPCIAYGFGGRIHVAWYLGFPTDHEYDGALRYRCATNYASGGPRAGARWRA